MKLRQLYKTLPLLFLACGCSTDYMSFEGRDAIQFTSKTDEVYTFAYFASNKQIDTVIINVMTIGDVVDYPRQINFEQVKKEWIYVYDETNPSVKVDSSYIDMEYPAEQGKHFEILGAEGNVITMPANSSLLRLPVIVKRDPQLRDNAYKLTVKLNESKDFVEGNKGYTEKKIVISDKLERPTQWRDNNYYIETYLGNWSAVKHRFMIDVTGEKWDNDCIKKYIKGYDYSAMNEYYMQKIRKALDEYNANPQNNPPLKDENGLVIEFPSDY